MNSLSGARLSNAVVCCLLLCYFAHSVTVIPFIQIFARAKKPYWVTGSELLWCSRPARTTCSAPAFPARTLFSAAKQHRCQQLASCVCANDLDCVRCEKAILFHAVPVQAAHTLCAAELKFVGNV
jgi:hypothetical protein